MNVAIASFTNVILCITISLYIGNYIFDKKVNIKNLTNIIAISIYGLYLGINQYLDEKLLKVLLAYTMLMILYKVLYKKDYSKTIVGSLLVYIIMFASEIIGGIGITYISQLIKIDIFTEWKFTFYLTLIIVTLMYVIFSLFKNKVIKIVNNVEENSSKSLLIIYTLLFVTSTIIINKMYKLSWEVNYELFINIAILVIFIGILIYVTRQKSLNNKIKTKYSELAQYTKLNDRLLEEYRIKSHEFSNQLAIIKGMYEDNNSDLSDYLNTLIKKNSKHKYNWINEVKYIQLSGIKGLLNFKIIEIKNLGINLKLNISKDIEKFKFNKFTEEEKDNLYTIVGVYLDNAKDASEKSKDKELIIESYLQNDNLVIVIGNTYSNKVNVEKLGEYNYSTKGKKHGIGLYLVRNIVKCNNNFITKTEVTAKYFYQTLTIKMKK